MKQIALIQKASPIRDYIELYLASFKEVSLVCLDSISEAIELLKSDRICTCIFIGNSVNLDAEVKELTTEMKRYLSSHPDCKVIGTNKGLSTQDWVFYIPSMSPPFKIIEAVRHGLSLPEEKLPEKYATVPISSLNYLSEMPCDIYFRIGQNPEDATYVKRFLEKDSVDPSEVSRYIEKNIKQVFILSDRMNEFSNLISSKISKRVNSGDGELSQIDVVTDALDYASYVLKSLGLNPHSQQIAEKVISNILASVDKMDKKKGKLFNQILNAKEDFYHKHNSLTALLACSVLEELRWDSSQETIASMTCAAYFHNFFINEESEISCVSQEKLSEIDSEEKKNRIINHAQQAASFVKDLKGIPYDVPMLILEHHGSLQGTGFPVQKKTSNQLSSLFMIVNEFSLQLLINNEKQSAQSIQDLLKNFLIVYGDQNQKILEALQNCMTIEINK
jgi:hypothetical protein